MPKALGRYTILQVVLIRTFPLYRQVVKAEIVNVIFSRNFVKFTVYSLDKMLNKLDGGKLEPSGDVQRLTSIGKLPATGQWEKVNETFCILESCCNYCGLGDGFCEFCLGV